MNPITENSMTPLQATDYLETFDGELVKVGAEAVREVGSIKIMTEAHETALRTFAMEGTGLLSATNAANFLEGLDKLIFGKTRPSEATAYHERGNYFARLAEKQTASARMGHVKSHAEKLATALGSIIAARSKNRDAWREKISDEIEVLERKDRLSTGMIEHEARLLRAGIDALEGRLVASDATHREAVRLTAKLRTTPDLSTLTDARAFALQIAYDLPS